MSTEIERQAQPQAPSSVEPTPVSKIAKNLTLNGLFVFFGCMLGEVYLPYLSGDPGPMEQHSVFAINNFFWTSVVSVVLFVILIGLDRRRVRRAAEG